MSTILPYDREAAVSYAHRWVYGRNPQYYDFSKVGGDCTNFASQCIFAGSKIMNFTPILGWYYRSARDRTPSWTGVTFLYNFLVRNLGAGPFGTEIGMNLAEPGDIVQLAFSCANRYEHSPIIVQINGEPTPEHILVAAHSYDADYRPLSTYRTCRMRFIHIDGVRRL